MRRSSYVRAALITVIILIAATAIGQVTFPRSAGSDTTYTLPPDIGITFDPQRPWTYVKMIESAPDSAVIPLQDVGTMAFFTDGSPLFNYSRTANRLTGVIRVTNMVDATYFLVIGAP